MLSAPKGCTNWKWIGFSPKPIVKNKNLRTVIKNWGSQYRVELDITVTKKPKGWSNVFHFTIGKNIFSLFYHHTLWSHIIAILEF